MRRLAVALMCCVALQAVLPAPVYGWWERIEQWSGPGPFTGWTIDARLACLTSPGGGGEVTVTSGAIISACRIPSGQKRRASLDLGMRFLKAEGSDRFGQGKEISLTTLEPSFSWRVFDNEALDFFDYGIGGGVYWVSSEAFPSVRGVFLEPVRLDFHAPSMVQDKKNWWWLAIPVFRVAWLVFPAGHESSAFLPGPGAPQRIARDRVRSIGVFVDLDEVITRIND